jgi:hypothetical protein
VGDLDRAVAETGVGAYSRFTTAGATDRRTTNPAVADKGASTMTEKEAFYELERQIQEWLESVEAGIGNIETRYAVKYAISYLRGRAVPMIRQLLRAAREHASAALSAKSQETKDAATRRAGARYDAALISTELLHLQVNCFIVAAYADAAGTPIRTIVENLARFEARVSPMLDALQTFDVDKMRLARARIAPDLQQMDAELLRALTDIYVGAALSKKVIQVADVLMFALSMYQVFRMPTVGGPPASSGSGPSGLILAYAGGQTRSKASALQIATAIEAIKMLIKIGAIDPTMGGSVNAPIPQLGKPMAMERSGAGSAPKPPKPAAPAAKSATATAPGAAPSVPKPAVFNRTLATLEKYKVDTKDPYTLQKLTEIYRNNRNPEALLMHARAGTGELRVLIRHAREPGVVRARFLRPSNKPGDVTPDIELTFKNGSTRFVEVRTMTEASPYLKVKDIADKPRAGIGAIPEFIKDLDAKIRRGQISVSRPGTIALHAPFQEVTKESLAGWRGIMKQILANGELPKGIRRIEVTGGTGPMLIFEPPKWSGVIVQ